MSSAPGSRGVLGELDKSCFGGVLGTKSESGGVQGKMGHEELETSGKDHWFSGVLLYRGAEKWEMGGNWRGPQDQGC